MTDTASESKKPATKRKPKEKAPDEAPVQVAPAVAGEATAAASDPNLPKVGEVVNLKTKGRYQIHDHTTGQLIGHEGVTKEVTLSPTLLNYLEEGRIELA